MDRNFFSEGFEGFLREKADQYKLYPSDRVWKNIDRDLRPRRKWPYLAAVLLLLGVGIGGKYYVSEQEKSPSLNHTLADKAITSGHTAASAPATSNQLTVASRNNIAGTVRSAAKSPSMRVVVRNTRHEQVNSDAKLSTPNVAQPEISEQAAALTSSPAIAVAESEHQLPELQSQAPLAMDMLPKTERSSLSEKSRVSLELYKINPVVPANVFANALHKWSFEMYVTPSVSFRGLTGKASNASYANYSNVGYSANFGYPADVNAAVVHKPSVGIELGSALLYPINKTFRFKVGLQLNYNQYRIQAYSYVPEMASFGANNAGFFSTPINEVSFYRNFNGYSRTWLKNEHFMISMPIGIEMNLAGREDRVQFGITTSIQPTYMLNDNAYLISTNLKNYAEATSLYRNWNLNGAVGAYLSVNTGPIRWVIGPQFRYQMLSSYTDNYPIREHLVEYGFKIAIKRSLH